MKYLSILIFLFFLGNVVNAQKDLRCGTPHMVEDFVKNIDPTLIARTTVTGMRMVKLYVTNFNSGTGFDPHTIPGEVALMNEQFRPHNICFELIGYRTIQRTGISVIRVDEAEDMAELQSYLVSNVLNMFVHFGIFDGPNEELAGTAYNIPNWYFSVASDKFGSRRTSSHEAGHCMGLFHTFHGNPGVESGGTSCQEFVNGTNASTCGDFIGDTPADPYGLTGATVTTSCVYDGTSVDPNNQSYTPNLKNTMSYWRVDNDNCTRDGFSGGQGSRMQNVFIPGQILAVTELSPINITLTNSIVINSYRVIGITGTFEAGGNYELHNTFGGFKASKIILKPGFRSFVSDTEKTFFFKPLECN